MRMQLSDEEAKLILRMREIEDAHRSGWNKAIEAAMAFAADAQEGKITPIEAYNQIALLIRGPQ